MSTVDTRSPTETRHAIDVRHLHKAYGPAVAVEDVSFTVERGTIFGILGRNGAGKTTTVECLEGLRRPDRGDISVLGYHPGRDRSALLSRIGVQLQHSELPERLKVWETLDLYHSFYPHPADWRALLDEWGLDGIRNMAVGKLSGGQKQRLFIALALIGNPEIAFLDELTTGLDPQARRETWDLIERIRTAGVTVVLVTHLMEEAERLCDQEAVIDRGRVVAVDSPAGLIAAVGTGQRMRFRPSGPFDRAAVIELPEVTGLTEDGGHVEVVGRDGLVQAVLAALTRLGVSAEELHLSQPNLEDAFVSLTTTGRL